MTRYTRVPIQGGATLPIRGGRGDRALGGRDLMIYLLRRADGSTEAALGGIAAGLPNLISWEGAVAGEGNSKGCRIASDTAPAP